MAEAFYRFGGYTLADLGLRLAKEGPWRSSVTVRRTLVTVPGVHGSTPAPGPQIYDEPQMSFPVWCLVSSQAELERKINQLTAILSQPFVLTRASGGVTASVEASLVTITPDEFHIESAAKLIIVLALPRVFFRGPEKVSAAFWFAVDQTIELPWLGDSTGPILDATVRVAGPISHVEVSCPVCGTGLSWDRDAGNDGHQVPHGQFLFFRRDGGGGGMGAWLSSNPEQWWWSGENVSAGLSWPGVGRLQLCPTVVSATQRRMLVNVSGGGRVGGQTTLTVLAAPSYL